MKSPFNPKKGIRRMVKDGLLTPKRALKWLQKQETVNPRIVRWLEQRARKGGD